MEKKLQRGNDTNRKGVLLETSLPLELFGRGKVRDTYVLPDNKLLIVTTDRISAFDRVLPDGIPQKGRVLNQMSNFWFGFTENIVPNHIISKEVSDAFPGCEAYANVLEGRSVIVKRAEPLGFECVVRGYLTGSGLKDYNRTGSVCGIELPKNLMEASKLDMPIFTPSTKNRVGHDENVSFDGMVVSLGSKLADRIRHISLEMYMKAAVYALQRGVIIADTKFEFGTINGELTLIDELLTPDSSRFWPAAGYAPGRSQPSYDKQPVRDYLEKVVKWDKESEAPHLPEKVIKDTTDRYVEIYERLTGNSLKSGLR